MPDRTGPATGIGEGMRRIQHYPDRESWLAARVSRQTLGASTCGPVLLGQYDGPWGVWNALRGEHKAASDAMRAGLRLEPYILAEYQRTTGCTLAGEDPCTVHLYEDWAHATLDDRSTDPKHGEGIVEAKLVMSSRIAPILGESAEVRSWDAPERQHLLPGWDLQVRYQMAVADLPWADVVALLPWYELRVWRVWRDLRAEEALMGRMRAWWERHIRDGEPPEHDGTDLSTAWLLAREREGKREATERERDLVDALEEAKENAASEDERAARIRADLIESITSTGHRAITVDGQSRAYLTANNQLRTKRERA